ncbi:MAG TPA: LysR family transcriptional regulator [Castellaniella sp.]|uniref:LysR family transcriptional regulator n=1 Tax=Castellaniella sp. TaxID=1955812 RepID=UPI002EF44017
MSYDLVDLRLFVAVADEGNISRGGAACFLAPSSASLRIKNLEATLGTSLFQRGARGVSLTEAGETMLRRCRACLAELEQMHADLAPYAKGIKAHVALSASSTAIGSFLPNDLQLFLRDYPEVRVAMSERLSHETLAAVASGQADVGIVTWDGHHPDLDFIPYRTNELTAVLPAGDAWATRSALSFTECLERPFVCPQSSSAIYTFIVNKAAALGQRLDVRIQVTSFGAMISMIRAGAGIGILPRPVLQLFNCDDVHILPLTDEWATRPLRICVHKRTTLSPYVQALVACLQAARETPFDPGHNQSSQT